MAKYKVLKVGLSQKVGEEHVDRKVGETIEVSDAAAKYLLDEGYIESVKQRTAKAESHD